MKKRKKERKKEWKEERKNEARVIYDEIFNNSK